MQSPPASTTFSMRRRSGSRLSRWLGPQIEATVEQLVLVVSLFWLLSANRTFLSATLKDRDFADASTWGFGVAMVVLVLALHVLMVGLVCNRWTVKPLLALLTVATAAASYYMGSFGVYLDPSMLRNVLRTDVAEAGELLNANMVLHLALYAGLPLVLLTRVRVVRSPFWRAFGRRTVLLLAALSIVVLAILAVYQPFSSLMRNHKEVRYLITPANYLWSAGAVLASDARGAKASRQPIGLDTAAGPSWANRKRPLVLVMVVGETARAANWGLSGYARQTTPRLAMLPVVNFAQVRSCGTNTEVSLPCMFAPVGSRNYDEDRIRGQESLLHVAARAGTVVHWRDNQSGCKGVCDGLPAETVSAVTAPGLCQDGRCLDEALVRDLDDRLRGFRGQGGTPGTHLIVLHMLGNHGPSYFRRYPPTFARFQPECRDDDLRKCQVQEIVNSYDNALLYTDQVLATTIGRLQAHADQVDSAMIFVSDHGESLGEKGLFLHGIPYPIAPDEQTRVPMLFWASDGFEAAAGLDAGCLLPELRRQAAKPQAHDALFHTVLGLMDIRTSLREPSLDLVSTCRGAP
ncbi:MAG: phosphoethanolamine transferase [Pseudomonadota bacterium]